MADAAATGAADGGGGAPSPTRTPRTRTVAARDREMLLAGLTSGGHRMWASHLKDAALETISDVLGLCPKLDSGAFADKDCEGLKARLLVATAGGTEAMLPMKEKKKNLKGLHDMVLSLQAFHENDRETRDKFVASIYSRRADSGGGRDIYRMRRRRPRSGRRHEHDWSSDGSASDSSKSSELGEKEAERYVVKERKEHLKRLAREKVRQGHDDLQALLLGDKLPGIMRVDDASFKAQADALWGSKPGLAPLKSVDWQYENSESALPTTETRSSAFALIDCVLDAIENGHSVDLGSSSRFKAIKVRECDSVEGMTNAKGEEIRHVAIKPVRLRAWGFKIKSICNKNDLSYGATLAYFARIYSMVDNTMGDELSTCTHGLDVLQSAPRSMEPLSTELIKEGATTARHDGEAGRGSSSAGGHTAKELCKNFARDGTCSYGASCKFAHVQGSDRRGRSEDRGGPSGGSRSRRDDRARESRSRSPSYARGGRGADAGGTPFHPRKSALRGGKSVGFRR
jgi:hypothetical protein